MFSAGVPSITQLPIYGQVESFSKPFPYSWKTWTSRWVIMCWPIWQQVQVNCWCELNEWVLWIDCLFRSLCRSINHLKQAFTKLYIRFYENYADEIDKINLLNMLVDNHEWVLFEGLFVGCWVSSKSRLNVWILNIRLNVQNFNLTYTH